MSLPCTGDAVMFRYHVTEGFGPATNCGFLQTDCATEEFLLTQFTSMTCEKQFIPHDDMFLYCSDK
jgi:hypothetical protein